MAKLEEINQKLQEGANMRENKLKQEVQKFMKFNEELVYQNQQLN